jgi:hypothetical protein
VRPGRCSGWREAAWCITRTFGTFRHLSASIAAPRRTVLTVNLTVKIPSRPRVRYMEDFENGDGNVMKKLQVPCP